MKSICMLVQNQYEIDIRVKRKAEALIAAGYSVDVLALHSPYSKSNNYTLDGVNVYTLSLGKKRGAIGRYYFEYLAFLFWAFFKLSQLMRRRAYAVIDVNNLPDILVFATLYARWKGSKVLFDMHEITPEFLMSKYGIDKNHWLVRLARFLEKASFAYADHVITINEPIQRLLESRGLAPSKSTIIMNSVDEAMFSSASIASSAVGSASDSGQLVMMYHGTLTHIYGLDIALEAFGQVHKQIPGAEFWILGNGPEKSSLTILSKNLGLESKVLFMNAVLPQEVSQWLGRCDIGVLSTRQDVFLDLSFSNKISEYIIMGRPLIAPRLKTFLHYFSEEALAYFEPNNPADLAKQMVRIYRDKELRARFAARAKQEYQPIRWEVMRERYLGLIDKILGTSPDQ